MRATIPMVLLVMLAEVPAAQAESAAAKVRGEIAASFAKGEFEVAVKKADLALKKATESGEQAQLHVLRAQALLALGQADKAKAAFIAAVQKDPTIELDAAHASPDALRLLERVRRELPATLVVLVKAGDADVAVDEKDLGPAPLQTQVAGGVHVVLAKGSDGRTTRVEAQVPPGRKVILELELEGPRVGEAPAPKPEVEVPPEPQPKVVQPEVRSSPRPPEVAKEAPSLRPAALGLMIGGGVVAVAGVIGVWQAWAQWNKLTNKSLPALAPGEGETIAATGKTLQVVGWVGVGVGVAAAATGAVLWGLDSRRSGPHVTLAPMPGGAMVGVYGVLP